VCRAVVLELLSHRGSADHLATSCTRLPTDLESEPRALDIDWVAVLLSILTSLVASTVCSSAIGRPGGLKGTVE
jgi:hypothetical protein